jgi:putative membrane protein
MAQKTALSISALAMGLALGAAAQTRDPAPTAPNRSIVTAEAPRAPAAENKNAEDLEFLTEALRTGLAEVQMGELAAQRGNDPRVRAYGAKLKTDHAAQAAEIEALLKPLNVAIPAEPSSDAQVHHAALARLSGEEFDSRFVEMMIASHSEAIEKYGAQTHANPDRTLHDFAAKALPMLREHLAEAQSLR